jgi:glycerol-3-phosphate dehydrogenase
MVMLEAARERGMKLLRGTVVGIDAGERVRAVHVEHEGERRSLEASHLVLAAGPMQKAMAQLIGIDLPLYAERHHKVSFADALNAVPRSAPMMIWLDEQRLPWSEEERAALSQDEGALAAAAVSGRRARPPGRRARDTRAVQPSR